MSWTEELIDTNPGDGLERPEAKAPPPPPATTAKAPTTGPGKKASRQLTPPALPAPPRSTSGDRHPAVTVPAADRSRPNPVVPRGPLGKPLAALARTRKGVSPMAWAAIVTLLLICCGSAVALLLRTGGN